MYNIPVPLAVDLVELDAAVDDLTLAAGVVEAGRCDPGLVMEHSEQHRWEDGEVA